MFCYYRQCCKWSFLDCAFLCSYENFRRGIAGCRGGEWEDRAAGPFLASACEIPLQGLGSCSLTCGKRVLLSAASQYLLWSHFGYQMTFYYYFNCILWWWGKFNIFPVWIWFFFFSVYFLFIFVHCDIH